MGSCVSVHKAPNSAITHPLAPSVGSMGDKLLIPSPVQKPDATNGGDRTLAQLALGSQRSPSRFRDSGMRDEIFFDSQPWLESDCEDDFLSVNGDFPSSGGSTPVHQTSVASQAPIAGRSLNSVAASSPSQPEDMTNKRLSELFKESSRRSHPYADKNTVPEATNPVSGGSSERTPNGVARADDHQKQCCIPRLISSRSFSERGKKGIDQ